MCATVCPSQALFFGTLEQITQLRPLSTPVNRFRFGGQAISTRVFMMAPKRAGAAEPYVDVTAAMAEAPKSRSIPLRAVPAEAPRPDPFEDVEV